jgi:hypothetical protein
MLHLGISGLCCLSLVCSMGGAWGMHMASPTMHTWGLMVMLGGTGGTCRTASVGVGVQWLWAACRARPPRHGRRLDQWHDQWVGTE